MPGPTRRTVVTGVTAVLRRGYALIGKWPLRVEAQGSIAIPRTAGSGAIPLPWWVPALSAGVGPVTDLQSSRTKPPGWV